MKYFVILLSLYMVFLSCVPCTDEAAMDSSDDLITAVHTTDEDEHQPAIDLCSPLCMCSCCGGLILSTTKTSLSASWIVLPKIFARYQQSFFAEPLSSIWQPPKL